MGDNYIKVEIGTLMGSGILPSYLEVKSPTRYVYIRREIDKRILEKNYCKIEYNLITNGKKMEDFMEYIGGKVILVPKVESGFKIDKQSRNIYIPIERRIFIKNRRLSLAALNKPNNLYKIDKEKYILENKNTRNILDMLKKKRLNKNKNRKLLRLRRHYKAKDNYCGLIWGFLL